MNLPDRSPRFGVPKWALSMFILPVPDAHFNTSVSPSVATPPNFKFASEHEYALLPTMKLPVVLVAAEKENKRNCRRRKNVPPDS